MDCKNISNDFKCISFQVVLTVVERKKTEHKTLMVSEKPSLLNDRSRKFPYILLFTCSYQVGPLSNAFLVICRFILIMRS